jgi:hypothetical protein
VQQFLSFNTLIELMLAISLSAASGFRVFAPLFALSAAAVLGHIDLPTNFDWIENPQALILFTIALTLEVIGYSIPWFDHLLDVLATPAAIVAGTVVVASVAPDLDPLAKWTLAIVAGGGTAGLTKSVLNLLRALPRPHLADWQTRFSLCWNWRSRVCCLSWPSRFRSSLDCW